MHIYKNNRQKCRLTTDVFYHCVIPWYCWLASGRASGPVNNTAQAIWKSFIIDTCGPSTIPGEPRKWLQIECSELGLLSYSFFLSFTYTLHDLANVSFHTLNRSHVTHYLYPLSVGTAAFEDTTPDSTLPGDIDYFATIHASAVCATQIA